MSEPAASIAGEDVQAGLRAPPRHVAIIMDGNGRWAKSRGLPRAMGHKEGVEALRRAVDCAWELGITHLTVYAFSTENWARPPAEVAALFDLLKFFVKRDLARLHKEGVRIRIVGSRDKLEPDILELVDHAMELTAGNKKLVLNIAFNYGGKAEIVNAVKRLAGEVEAGRMKAGDITEQAIARLLWTADSPDPDLLIRTSGELRLSNFLLWSGAYSELMFMDVWWPDFDRKHLEQAIDAFRRRDRRFGA